MVTSSASKLIAAFIMLIVGLALVSTVASQGNNITTKTASSDIIAMDVKGHPLINQTAVYTVTNAPTGWKSYECPLTNFVVANASGYPLTLTTDYTVTSSTGQFLLVNNDDTNTTYGLYPTNNTYVSYSYCPDDYMNLSWGRTAINLIPGFFGLALLLVAVGLCLSVLRDEHII